MSINWTEQWSLFAPNFKDGKAHIDLSPYPTLHLLPGPGFGDCSHSTTRLMLNLMKDKMTNHTVLDIGCGSGILSLAALLMGASSAHGIDIDPAALEHAHNNLILNNLTASFSLQPTQSPSLVLMNMTFAEQQAAWQPLKAPAILTSGILNTQKASYLEWTSTLGWKPISHLSEGEWVAFQFSNTDC
jgi:ribosomal protein L11 methyltransferase